MTPELAAEMMGMKSFPDGWSFQEVFRCGKPVGWFCTKGSEIHCFRQDDAAGQWLTRQDIERLVKPIFSQFGHLTTVVRKANLCGHRFVKRLGFYPVRDDGLHIHYRAERLKHARL